MTIDSAEAWLNFLERHWFATFCAICLAIAVGDWITGLVRGR
jgi:hypothetical protein